MLSILSSAVDAGFCNICGMLQILVTHPGSHSGVTIFNNIHKDFFDRKWNYLEESGGSRDKSISKDDP